MDKIDIVPYHKADNFHETCNSSHSSQNILKRLERKQSRKNFQSPRSRFEDKGSLKNLCEDELENVTQENVLRPSFIDADALGRSICYLSPKNSKMSPFLMSPQKDTKHNKEAISINNIKTKLLIEFENERGCEQVVNKRRCTLKTGKSPMHRKCGSWLSSNMETKIERKQNEKECKNECELMKQQNRQLFNENKRLNETINKLKGQNETLQRGLQQLTRAIQEQKKIRMQICVQNQILFMKNQENEDQIEEVKESYKGLADLTKSYDVLMHMHHKMKYELQTIKQRNRILQMQNDKSASKIHNLFKMLEDSPSTPAKPRITCGRVPLLNKQNQGNERIPQVLKTPRSNARKMNDDSIFDLSPE